MCAVFIDVQSCTGVLDPGRLQAIIDAEIEAKNKHDREHPFVCDFMIRKNVKCNFRGKNVGGLKVHAGAVHMWKHGEELKFTNASRVASSSSESPPAPTPPGSHVVTPERLPVAHNPVISPARGAAGGSAAAVQHQDVSKAPSTRRCSRCNAVGHQANSKKCPRKASDKSLDIIESP